MAYIAKDDLIPWRERVFVTVAEAGVILGRSTSWVRDQLMRGPLEAGALPGNGPTVVTVSSVLRVLLDREAPRRIIAPAETKAKNWRPYLRLVYSKI